MFISEILFTSAYYLVLLLAPFIIYIVVLSENTKKKPKNNLLNWYYPAKRILCLSALKEFKAKFKHNQLNIDVKELEEPQELHSDKETDTHVIHGLDQFGNSIFAKITLMQHRLAEITLHVRLCNGNIYTLPNNPQALLCSTSSRQWKADGLLIQIVEPSQRIRLVYNGFLKRNSDGNVEHVKFNFIWNAADKPLYYPRDASTATLADALSLETWKDGDWIEFLGDERGYEQYGALKGFIVGESFEDSLELCLPTTRQHYWGTADAIALYRRFSVFIVGEDGTLLNIGCKSINNGCSQLKYGTILNVLGFINTIEDHDIDLEFIGTDSIPDTITIHVKGGKRTHKCVLHLNQNAIITTESSAVNGWESKMVAAECVLDAQLAKAVVSFWYAKKGPGVQLPNPFLKEPKTYVPYENFLAPFSNIECQMVSLAGGKGSSLALLSSIKSQNFSVPEGFVILTNAFRHQLENNLKLKQAVEELEDVSRNKINKDLAKSCQEVQNLFNVQPVCKELADAIFKQLEEYEKRLGENVKWAVRSSGINEDSEDLSAAGQNATILGCLKESLLDAVQACWASLFTYQSVQYRRQLGLDVNCNMAVVIQRMVPAEVAGVLFTCHPTTCDTSKMVITSNYGLGESVVSGQADPDTITIRKTWKGELSIESSQVGSKKVMVHMSKDLNTNKTVEVEEVENRRANTLSLTKEQILLLGVAGLELEKAYGEPRDLEWAFYNNQLYLLQSRPVTTLYNWTEYELQHEFDFCVLTNRDVLTTANVGEVLPGALTALSNSVIMHALNTVFHQYTFNTNEVPHAKKFNGVINHHAVMSVTNSLNTNVEEEMNIITKSVDMAVCGHLVTDENIHRLAKARFGTMSNYRKLLNIVEMIRLTFKNKGYFKKALRVASDLKWDVFDYKSALDKFNAIIKIIPKYIEVVNYHSRTSQVSVSYQVVAMSILSENNQDLTINHCEDMATLLASCSNVVSVEVPHQLEKICNLIIKSNLKNEFATIDPKQGIDWLKVNCPEAKEELDNFLNKHGHRGFREFEIQAESWGMNPTLVIEMMQVICKGDKLGRENEYLSVDDTVAKLVSPKKENTKKALRFLVKKCRDSVSTREATKSELIRMINNSRKAFRDLSQSMVIEGMIPDAGLIYHFTIYELEQIIQRRNPALIRKGLQRQRLYSKWDKLRLPELMAGYWKLEENESDNKYDRNADSHIYLKGTPACSGNVTGRACVILDLKDIGHLQAGDVLITHATDIAWSPYFPILSAVVTELGGLVSHGAVVAREYGLPCLVGVQDATNVFKTGDIVHISGKNGILELVSEN